MAQATTDDTTTLPDMFALGGRQADPTQALWSEYDRRIMLAIRARAAVDKAPFYSREPLYSEAVRTEAAAEEIWVMIHPPERMRGAACAVG